MIDQEHSQRSQSADSRFEIFEHGADIGVRGLGPSLEQALAQAARALFSLMVDDLQTVRPRTEVSVQASGYDLESLLVAWLNALLTESDLRSLLLSQFEVELEADFQLTATAWGEPFSAHRAEQGVEVKGATFCQVAVYEQHGRWIAQCVVDV